jgi:hypothetical protein
MEEPSWRSYFQRELAKLHDLDEDNGNYGPNAPRLTLILRAKDLAKGIRNDRLPTPVVTATSGRAIHIAWAEAAKEFSIMLYPDEDEIEWLFRNTSGEVESGAVTTVDEVDYLVDRYLS